MPVAHLVLSDLFDSSPPPPGAMDPPDLAAFSTSRPPPAVAAARPVAGHPAKAPPPFAPPPTAPRAAAPTLALPSAEAELPVFGVTNIWEPPRQSAVPSAPPPLSASAALPVGAPPSSSSGPNSVVPLPSISVGAETRAPPPAARPPSPPPPSSLPEQARAEAGEETEHRRRSVPTLESVGNAAAQYDPSGIPEKNVVDSDGAARPAIADIPRFASDIPTSRPPDVVMAPTHTTATPSRRELRPDPRPVAQSGITAPAPVQTSAKVSLPSIMLAADVEAEGELASRRALRAARATVRIELPADFGRPGSPLPGGVPPIGAIPGRPAAALGVAPALAEPSAEKPPLRSALSRHGIWLLAAVLILVAGGLFMLRPRPGSLVINAFGPGHRSVENLQVFVDGAPLCTFSPCKIEGLSAGEHKLHATASGLTSNNEELVVIIAGEESVSNLQLVSTQLDQQSGSMRIAATEPPRTLYVDDARVGRLPQEVTGLSSGKHWIKLDAEDGSTPIEKSVTILPGQAIDVDPNPTKRDKALLTIQLSPESEGASITLDEAFLLDFPAELELEPNSVHTLSATKPGFADYSREITADEGGTEKSIEVALTRLEGAPPVRAKAKARKSAKTTTAAANADAAQGVLNISSVPPSQIILNGRPLGTSPKTGVSVPGDSLQTIVFVHPKMGRRRAQKFVPAGKERTVAIRF